MDFWVPVVAVLAGLAILLPKAFRHFNAKPSADRGCGGCSGCSEAGVSRAPAVQKVQLQKKG